MTEEQSDIRGKSLGDEYFAALDFVECLKNLRNQALNIDSEDETCHSNILRRETQSSLVECIMINSDGEEEFSSTLTSNQTTINRDNSFSDLMISKRFFRDPENRFYFKNYFKMNDIYVMDAKICGNIGRYFNHSCSPNVYVQNVFVDTYDMRFPWIAFFASKCISAGTELCWDYNYQPNSVEGRVLYCSCGAKICRGRLL